MLIMPAEEKVSRTIYCRYLLHVGYMWPYYHLKIFLFFFFLEFGSDMVIIWEITCNEMSIANE